MRTDEIGKTSPQGKMWWKVDLGGVYNIYSVNILFKSYDGLGNYVLICTLKCLKSTQVFRDIIELISFQAILTIYSHIRLFHIVYENIIYIIFLHN